jgi:hypothetical protein
MVSGGKECVTIFVTIASGIQVLASTQPLSVSRLSRQCGILVILQTYRPSQPVTWIALFIASTVSDYAILVLLFAGI